MPFDLSKVLFIATANLLDPIPAALRDRMEIVHLPGYTEQEKIEIGKRFLIPKQMTNHGLKDKHIDITDGAMTELVRSYTHEAGVRNLEREIANVMRKVARQVAEGRKRKTVVDEKKLVDLPRARSASSTASWSPRTRSGSATGLVVTEVGGDVVAIEVTRMEGKEDFILTGQLGEVMRESARAGLSWTRAHARELGIDREVFEKNTLHIHVPAGAIPKDGPSAGHHDGHRHRQRPDRHPRPQGRGHDRRDHAARSGPARSAGSRARSWRRTCRAPRWSIIPKQEREGPRRHPRRDPQVDEARPGRERWSRSSRRRSGAAEGPPGRPAEGHPRRRSRSSQRRSLASDAPSSRRPTSHRSSCGAAEPVRLGTLTSQVAGVMARRT